MSLRPLPADARVRAALRSAEAAPADARERVRTRLGILPMVPLSGHDRPSGDALRGSTEHGDPSGGDGGATMRGAPGANGHLYPFGAPARSVSAIAAAMIAAAAFVAGGVAGAGLLWGLQSRRPAPAIDRATHDVVPSPAHAATAPVSGLDLAAQASLAPATAPDRGPSPVATPSSAANAQGLASDHASRAVADGVKNDKGNRGSSRFAAERLLLDEARAAIVRGEPQVALGALDRHQALYGDGLLGQERDAMRVEALVGAGRYDDARTAARAFHARDPGSLFASTVDGAIASIPASGSASPSGDRP